MRAAIYARVSTFEQHVENQLQELRTYCERRGWAVTEFVDRGDSGAKDRRPALDECRSWRSVGSSTFLCAGVWTGSVATFAI